MLNELGLRAHVPGDGHPAFAGWLHLVRRLRAAESQRVIGLVPASDRVSGAVVGVQLAIAMTHASGLRVTILDFNTVHPAWDNAELLEFDETSSKEIFPNVNVMRITRVTLRNDWNWVKARLEELETSRQYVLCDMTGVVQLGALDEGLALVDGVVSLVRPGHVWEWQLSRLHRRFGSKDMGVLFVDEGSTPGKRRA